MTMKLRQNFDDILVYRNQLEELVEERTLDLKKEITERRGAEQALRASEELLRTIVDQSPMGIILWDTDFCAGEWNQAAEKIFGYSAAEAVGLPAKNLLPESMHPHIGKIWQKLISTQIGVRSRNENIRKDGQTILCDWFNTPIRDASGTILGALSLVENVTERMRTEKELLKIEKLESTGILAGGIAHDFNNILTAILGNINLSLFDDNLSPKIRNLLVSAEKAAIRAKDLTQQLLTFAKGGEPIRESTSLTEIIRDSAAFVLHGCKVSCTYRLPDNLWFAVVDRGQISQVIQNIVLNSRHSMPKGGNITIACENVHPAEDPFSLLDPESIYVKISIKDSGIGIPADLLDKIFDPYFSTKQEGSGLGLAITHSIINKHHGHILVNSEQGKGTEFTIYLPAVSRASDKKDAGRNVTATTKPLRVLVMDDDKAVQVVLQKMLEKLNHSVILADNGKEAIDIYLERFDSTEPVDLVIVDLTIPGGLGGKETIMELQKTDPKIRAIVSSGYSNDPVMASFNEHGFCAAVTKPYVLQELSEAIEAACRI
jgi:PAS domain S-box-containing protein